MNKNSLRQLIVTEMILADVNGGGHAPPKKRSLFEMMDDSYLSELEDGRLAHSMESVVNLFEEVPKDNWTVTDPKTGQKRAPKTSGPRSEKQQAAADAAKAAWKATKDAAVAVLPPSTPTDGGQASQNQDNDEPLPADPQSPAIPINVPQENPDSSGIEDEISTGLSTIPVAQPDNSPLLPAVMPPLPPPLPDVEVEDPPLTEPDIIDVDFTESDEDNTTLWPGNGDSEGNEDAQGDNDDGGDGNLSSGWSYLSALNQSDSSTARDAADPDNTNESHLSLIDLLYDA